MLDECIGQRNVIEALRIFVEAARARKEALSHLLLYSNTFFFFTV